MKYVWFNTNNENIVRIIYYENERIKHNIFKMLKLILADNVTESNDNFLFIYLPFRQHL